MPRLADLPRVFWSKVDVRGTNECWYWLGPINCTLNVFNEETGKYTTRPAAHVAMFLNTGRWPEKGKVFRPVECGHHYCMNTRHYRELSWKQLNRRKRWANKRQPKLPPQRVPAT